tara:strand:- start:887 stop:1342 length:456 start_codon:yes stop_codon:yes gene_type:complete
MKLNTFEHKISTPKKRLGRGIGSSKGKTSGRGHKGQKSRSGVAIKSFEGGQMPLYRRLPKRGFKSIKSKNKTALINLSKMQKIIEKEKSFIKSKINLSSLQKANIIGSKYNKLKILGTGDIKEKLDIESNAISKSAKEKIEKIGGKITLIK